MGLVGLRVELDEYHRVHRVARAVRVRRTVSCDGCKLGVHLDCNSGGFLHIKAEELH